MRREENVMTVKRKLLALMLAGALLALITASFGAGK